MKQINWSLEELAKDENIKTVIICNDCGWMVQNPQPIDQECPNCGIKFEKSKSEIKTLNQKVKK